MCKVAQLIFLCSLLGGAAFGQTGPAKRIWVDDAIIQTLPMSGPAWSNLLEVANSSADMIDLSNQDWNGDVVALAAALVYVRTGDENYRVKAETVVMESIGTEDGGRTLALARNLVAIVIAADYCDLNPVNRALFAAWLDGVRHEDLSGRTLISTHEDRPNNWGTHAGASRAAADIYLGDLADLARCALVFRGYLGDYDAYHGFAYGDLSWQANPLRPVGINPKGSVKQGVILDGHMPDDLRRGSGFTTEAPAQTGYPWEGLQGVIVQAEILYKAGYQTWEWQDRAIDRAVFRLHAIGWLAEGDDEWQPWLVNYRYGTPYPRTTDARHGKNMGFTDWTHASRGPTTPPEEPPPPDEEPPPPPDEEPVPPPEEPPPHEEPPPPPTVEVKLVSSIVSSGSDDAEERKPPKSNVSLPGGGQTIGNTDCTMMGLRFQNVQVPRGAKIRSAYVQFVSKDKGSAVTLATIRGQASGNAPTFGTAKLSMSNRPDTATSVVWNVPAWTATGVTGDAQLTPSLFSIVQEIVDRTDWNPGNAIVVFFEATGSREAGSIEGGKPAKLIVEYEVP